ncbi:MAG: ORF6N domain-containing protein [Bacteroidetes bacterium]|nr:ORF6N domain-containing protein [Bacteroidota bacterium]
MELTLIQKKIHEVRGQKILLDFDLAELYEVETKSLNQAVKRNNTRFPERFMFRLSMDEWDLMRSQTVAASNQGKRNMG